MKAAQGLGTYLLYYFKMKRKKEREIFQKITTKYQDLIKPELVT